MNIIDLKDRKILYLLKQDARISLKDIAKTIRSSPETTHYRIKKLEQEYITGYTLIVDHTHFGFETYNLYISLRALEENSLDKLSNFLKTHKRTKYIEKCVGEYDFIVTLTARNRDELSLFTKQVYNMFNYIIDRIDFIMRSEILKIDHLAFLFNETDFIETVYKNLKSKIKLDDKDKELIKALSQNPKSSFIQLSNQLSLSHDACSKRYKKLLEQKTIRKTEAIINYSKFVSTTYILLFQLENFVDQSIIKYKEWLNKQKNILLTTRLLGSYDMEIHFLAKDQEEFNKIITQIRNQFYMRKHSLLVKTEQLKYQGSPPILWE